MQVRLLVVTAIGVLLAAFAPAAQAAAPGGTAGGSYCAVDVSRSETLTCAATAGDLVTRWAGSSQAPATELLIARLYDDANYDTSAGFLEIYAASDCTTSTTDVDWEMSDLGAWRDRVSSFRSFGDCVTRLWSSTSFGGTAYPSSTGWLASSSYVGAAFNDKARSVQFT